MKYLILFIISFSMYFLFKYISSFFKEMDFIFGWVACCAYVLISNSIN